MRITWLRSIAALLLGMAFLTLTGCASDLGLARAAEPSPGGPASAAAQVLYRFAEAVSRGDVPAAAALLAPSLRGAYAYKDYAPIRNTPHMEIVKLVDHTGDREWSLDLGSRDGVGATDARVFYVEVRYKVLGIIDSYFVDGEIYHHKATVARFQNGQWLITELSGTRRRE